MSKSSSTPYHHGDLRAALIEAAIESLRGGVSPQALSLRDLAKRSGVSHAAPAHHFRDKTGLFTAIAAEGFDRLRKHLQNVERKTGDFLEIGGAYVDFAVKQPTLFEVMFNADLHRVDDPELSEAKRAAAHFLYENDEVDAPTENERMAALGAWSIVHGFATLWNSGNISHRRSEKARTIFLSVAPQFARKLTS